MCELHLKRLGIFGCGEIAAKFFTGAPKRARDARHKLTDALLGTGFRHTRLAKIFRRGDIRCELAPRFRHFHLLHLKDSFAFFVVDGRIALFPFGLLVRMNAGCREVTCEGESTPVALLMCHDLPLLQIIMDVVSIQNKKSCQINRIPKNENYCNANFADAFFLDIAMRMLL